MIVSLNRYQGGIMIWRFSKHGKMSNQEKEIIERRAEKLVGYTFIILASYILYESISKLINKEIPEPSLLGKIVAVLSIIMMPILFYNK